MGALAPLLKTVVFSHHDAQACHLHPPGHSECPGRPSEGQWTVADLTATLCVFCPKEEPRRGQPEGRTEVQFVPDLDGCHFLGHLLGTQVASGAPHPPEAPGQRHEHQHSAHGKPSGAAPGEQRGPGACAPASLTPNLPSGPPGSLALRKTSQQGNKGNSAPGMCPRMRAGRLVGQRCSTL